MARRFTRSKNNKSARRRRSIRGGDGDRGAADYGVKVWGFDQVADPNQGNAIHANKVMSGGAFLNALPTMDNSMSSANMSKQALDMQNASVQQMVSTAQPATVQSQSSLPQTGGRRRRHRRRGSKRKYGYKIKNGRGTKTIY